MNTWQIALIDVGTFLVVSTVAYLAVVRLLRRNQQVHQRIDDLAADGRPPVEETRRASGLMRWLGSLLSPISTKLLPGDDEKRTRLQLRLQHAGLTSRSAAHLFVTFRLILMVAPIPAIIMFRSFHAMEPRYVLLFGAVACGIGLVLPGFWLDRRKKRRQIVLGKALPDFLDLLVTCLESGLSLDAALRRVTGELRFAHPVLAEEMERVQAEIDMGASADRAIQHFADRTDLESLQTLATFLHQARRFGTSMAEALRTHSEMLREQRELRAEELAQKAAVKVLFPTLLFIFPAVFIVLAGPAAIQLNDNLAQQDQQTESPTRK